MRCWTLTCTVALLTAPLVLSTTELRAQGITTATIAGIVTDQTASGVEAVDITVHNRATGFRATSRTDGRGRFVVQGLEIGGPYTITADRIGFKPETRDSLTVALGQTVRVDFVLEPAATELAPVIVQAESDPRFSSTRTGTGSWVTDTALRRLPTVNRDLYAFVQLTPQMSSWYGPSAGGVNYTFNGILIDGVNAQALFGGNPASGVWGARPISIEAVKEYEVLLSSYDVRQGNYAGAQINAVTRRGTNDLRGTGFLYWRNETLARDVSYLRAAPYDRAQFGGTISGPIIRDRIHFFIAAELQHLNAPALGPYLGQSGSSPLPLPVDTAAINGFGRWLQTHGLQGGAAGPVVNADPAVNLFGRLDVALPRWNSRAVLRHNYSQADTNAFSRPIRASRSCPLDSCFPLSSLIRSQRVATHTTVLQLFTNLRSGAYSELSIDRLWMPALNVTPSVREPLVVVSVPDAANPGLLAFLQAGSVEFAQGNENQQRAVELAESFNFPVARHFLTVGGSVQWYRMRSAQVPEAYGVWRFSSLNSLELDSAADYRVTKDLGGGDASIDGARYGFYAGDRWQVSDRLSLTFGVRGDIPVIHGSPPYSARFDSLFGRRTNVIPSGDALFSPRLGFNWSPPGDVRQQLRGGAGLFAGRPPVAWLLRAFQNFGDGFGTLHCSNAPGLPPKVPATLDYRSPPMTCANGAGLSPGPVDLLDKHLKYPQTLKVSLGYDRSLPWGIVATVEGLYTKGVHDFLFVNRRLQGPVGTDRHGRVLYGRVDSSGTSSPALVNSLFPEVIELQNQSSNYAYNFNVQLDKRFSNGVEASASYSYARVRDVQTDRYLAFADDWQFGRVVSGDHTDLHPGISDFDQPHKVVVVGTYTAPWTNWKTDFSFYYVGTSGVPYTYTATGTVTGDLNADGSNANDPIYVPTNAADTAEIQFANLPGASAAQQQGAFEAFIAGTPCLVHQRGRILSRNSCRSPWIHTLNLAVRQMFPPVAGHTLSAELQVFNLLNLLNRNWGQLQLPSNPFRAQVGLLRQVGQTLGPPTLAQPVFLFDVKARRYYSDFAESNYQIQLAARFTF